MSDKQVTYLQFKATADKLSLMRDNITADDVYNILHEIITKEEADTFFARWKKDHVFIKNTAETNRLNTQELERALSITRATLESTADAILIVDKNGNLVDFNHKFLEMSGVPTHVIEKGKDTSGLAYLITLLKDPEELIDTMMRLTKHPEEGGNLNDVYFKDGRILERYSQPHRFGNEIVGRVWSFRDVTEKRKQEASLRLSNRAISASTHGIMIIENNKNFTITHLNTAAIQLLGIREEQIMHQSFLTAIEGFSNASSQFLEILKKKFKGELTLQYYVAEKLFLLEIKIDPVYEKESQRVSHFVAIINDITKRIELENILKYKAVHDTLTGLPNKNYLEDTLRHRIQSTIQKDEKFALLFIDIDRFKNVNDTLGHRVGDELLCLFSKRLQNMLRKDDVIARIGGDEFIVYIHRINELEGLTDITDRLLETCRRKFNYGKHEFNITASMGIVFFPDCGHDPDTLIRNADIAMYKAKQSGRNQSCMYNRLLNQTMSRRVQIENELYNAVQNNELELYYQPIYNIKTNSFLKAEALLRWKNKNLGFVSPLEFIGVAEDIGMMNQIGQWIICTATQQIDQWKNTPLSGMMLNVNVSAKQLLDPLFTQNLKDLIQKNEKLPEKMMMEITESFFLSGERGLDTLGQVSNLGVKITIDDFGTGYSNLNYLHRLHVSSLKIDKTFIDQIEQEIFNDSVILAIIAIGKRMGFNVVAEGVETKKQYEFLSKNHCDEIQGYYFSKILNGTAKKTNARVSFIC